MQNNYDDVIHALADEGRLFRSQHGERLALTPGDGDRVAWANVDYGPEAVVAGVEDYTGHTHEWVLAEPITGVADYLGLVHTARLYGVTVYEISQQWGGPEEGGWWYDTYHPLAVFLAHRRDTNATEAHRVAVEWAEELYTELHPDGLSTGDRKFIACVKEAVIGRHTTVVRSYYC